MAYTTINKSTDYFNTKLWTGDASSNRAITGVGFQPDWLWIKSRDASESHCLFDSVRGADKRLFSNSTSAEDTSNPSNRLVSFDTDGFTIGLDGNVNGSGDKYVGWSWLAGGSSSSNSNGSITSTVSANTTAGFSIVTYTGTGSAATVGHGLGSAPSVILTKTRSNAEQWFCHWSVLGTGSFIKLDTTNAAGTNATNFPWNPQANTFGLSSDGAANSSGRTYVAYCFAEKPGYSKFGSYVGNGNADGTFVYTGFKPAWILTKRSSGSGDSWNLLDSIRNPANPGDKRLTPDTSNAEATTTQYDILSNGFKTRATTGAVNASGQTYIYMAFGQSLVGSNNIPCTAR